VLRNEVNEWVVALEERYLADLTFQEVSRALRALSSTYVERRRKLAAGAALAGAGKRAAFALFYAPLHYILVERITSSLHAAPDARLLVDLGCGTGAAGAAWAAAAGSFRRVVGIDRSRWALDEAARTYRRFGLKAETRVGDVSALGLPAERAALIASFTLNELENDQRRRLLTRFIDGARAGHSVLIVEPIARSVTGWWNEWQDAFESAGGRADEWRFAADLPPLVAKLDRAAGLDHRELTGRSLWLDGSRTTPGAARGSSS